MAVFKEKNGAMKGGGYPREQTSAQIRSSLPTFEQSISAHPLAGRYSANERNVRAAATTLNGSIRKGGASKKNN